MMRAAGGLRLSAFNSASARTIVEWVSSADELRAWAGTNAPFPPTVELLQAWHAETEVHPLVLFDGGALAGYGEIWVDREEGEIELARLIIAPERRGKGLGREFVRLLLERAAAFGMGDVFVRVVPENLAAIRCYAGAGFVRVPADAEGEYNLGQPRAYVWMRCSFADCASVT